MKKKVIGIVIGLSIILASLFAINIIMSSAVDSGDKTSISVEIKSGATTTDIAKSLKEKDLIRSESFFKLKSKLSGNDGKYFVGKFKLNKTMNISEIMDALTKAPPGKVVTITEGTNLSKIAAALEKEGIISAEDFLNEAENGNFDYEFLKDAPNGKTRLEGYIYPDTYMFEEGQSAHSIIDTMLKTFEKNLSKDYEKLSKEKGRNFHEILTIASIIEREAKGKDKPLASSVIYNRLKIDMPLQMDSTLTYILGKDKIRNTIKDTTVASPYNTYTNKGLPPGPICCPSKDSIDAALNPKESKYLYFIVSEKMDGTLVFSETYDEFLKDKEKFDKAYTEYIKKNPDKE